MYVTNDNSMQHKVGKVMKRKGMKRRGREKLRNLDINRAGYVITFTYTVTELSLFV